MNIRGLLIWTAWKAGANLQGADLQEADLQEADLRGADLQEADLRGVRSSKRLLRINGFKYDVIINGEVAQIGCKYKTIQEWIDRDWTNSTVPKKEQEFILELFKKVFINE